MGLIGGAERWSDWGVKELETDFGLEREFDGDLVGGAGMEGLAWDFVTLADCSDE